MQEDISCWGWSGESPQHLGGELYNLYNLDMSIWAPPRALSIMSAGKWAMIFPSMEILSAQPQKEWLDQVAKERYGGTEKSPPFPNKQMFCIDNFFYVPSPHIVNGASVQYTIEEHPPDGPVWTQAGQYLHFTERMDNMADELVASLLGSAKGCFVTIHIR